MRLALSRYDAVLLIIFNDTNTVIMLITISWVATSESWVSFHLHLTHNISPTGPLIQISNMSPKEKPAYIMILFFLLPLGSSTLNKFLIGFNNKITIT